jgi:hypothetical protein
MKGTRIDGGLAGTVSIFFFAAGRPLLPMERALLNGWQYWDFVHRFLYFYVGATIILFNNLR